MTAFSRPSVAALALLLAAAPAAAADAPRGAARHRLVVHPRPPRPVAAPLDVEVAPGVGFATPFAAVAGGGIVRVPHYIGPDGAYDEYADLVKSINGTPCGQDCTRRSLARWGYAPAE